MTVPDFVFRADWIGNKYCEGECFWSGPSTAYVRRDPAVLAELPEMQALIAAALLKWPEFPADAKAALDAYVAGKVREALEAAEQRFGFHPNHGLAV